MMENSEKGQFHSCWIGNSVMFWHAKNGGFHSHVFVYERSLFDVWYDEECMEILKQAREYATVNEIKTFVLCVRNRSIIIDMRPEIKGCIDLRDL